MFLGTTPQVISNYLAKELDEIKPKRVFVACSGNFVVEQIAKKTLPDCELHSTDVSLYSCAIGWGMTDKDFRLEIKDNSLESFSKYLNSPINKASLVIFLTEILPYRNKEKKYYMDLYAHSIRDSEKYLKKILEKLITLRAVIGDMIFYGVDNVKLWDMLKEGDYVFYDPPVILGDYEKQFKPVEEVLDWDRVEYTELNDQIKEESLKRIIEKGAIVTYRTNNPIKLNPELGLRQTFYYKYKNNGAYCLYSNRHLKPFVGYYTSLKDSEVKYPIITEKDEIKETSGVKIIPVKGAIGNHYRLLWVKKAIMADMGTPFLILVDGKVIGMVQISPGQYYGIEHALIVSDPSAPTSRYKRLSKLVLYIISTEEFLSQINDLFMWEHKGFTTRVLTNYPVSMKYRGELFSLVERENFDQYYKYRLIYRTKKLNKTIKDGLKEWLKKHSQYTI